MNVLVVYATTYGPGTVMYGRGPYGSAFSVRRLQCSMANLMGGGITLFILVSEHPKTDGKW